MLIYILKFSACLTIFLVFYKLFLERENMHQFKRFYLMGMVLASIVIPFVTFTQYIEPQPVLDSFSATTLLPTDAVSIVEITTNYIPIILWSIYGIGVLLFGLKFSYNLVQMVLKIKKNPKQKTSNFINVLLKDLVAPHTFFSYIFLNKYQYQTHQIPQEVLLHEQTHAVQKHSIDVLFVELLQVVFWFNPLIHILKNAIKLNHEFLADNAVLSKGVQANNYQHILLSFSLYNDNVQLANAINYSSIKKRLTVMKTHTSKTKMWLRSLVLLPLLALTLYGFSERKEVVREISILNNNPVLEINHNPDVFKLNGKNTSLAQLKVDFLKVTNNKKSDLKIVTVGGIKMSLIYKISEELKDNLIEINLADGAYIIDDTFVNEAKDQDGASREQMKEYNRLAKHYNSLPEKQRIIKQKDIERMEYIYHLMSAKQKKDAEPFPNIAPPPPPPAPEPINPNLPPPPPPPIPENATKEQKEKYKKIIKEYNRKYTVKNGKVSKNPPPPPPPVPDNATKEQKKKYEENIKKYKIAVEKSQQMQARVNTMSKQEIAELKKVKEDYVAQREKLKNEKLAYKEARAEKLKTEKSKLAQVKELRKKEDVLKLKEEKLAYMEAQKARRSTKKRLARVKEIKTPQPPKSPLDHVIDMAKKGAIFYLEGKEISSDKAIKTLKKNKHLNIQTLDSNSKQPKVYISKKPIVIEN